MECLSAASAEDVKCTSPSKKSNGLGCNGVADHQSDCDTMSKEAPSLSSNSVETVSHEGLTTKQALVNGFSSRSEDKTEERAGENAACESGAGQDVAALDVSNVDKQKEKRLSVSPVEEACAEKPDPVPVEADEKSSLECDKEMKSDAGSKYKLEENSLEQKTHAKDKELISVDREETNNTDVSGIKSNDNQESRGKDDSDSSKNEDLTISSSDNPEKLSVKNSKSALDEVSDSCVKVTDELETTNVAMVEKSTNDKNITEQERLKSATSEASKESEKLPSQNNQSKSAQRSESTGDDIEIIGESFTQAPSTQSAIFVSSGLQKQPMTTLPPHASFTSNNSTSLLTNSNMHNAMLLQNMTAPGPHAGLVGTVAPPGSGNYVFPTAFAPVQGVSLLNSNSNAPPTPKSSMDQIELIRWEIQNRINVRPKYFKPNPSSELGPLAKFLFDIGSDLIKESVYHDLVKIQSKKNDDDKLSAKEREDLAKLKEIEKDLQATIGHLKLKLKKKCQGCGFQTESNNVLFYHKQFPHEDNKNLRCAHCYFSTKQSMAFKFHMEAEHAVQGKLHEKKAFFECHMCPYENNQEQKLVLHRERCLKQFRPLFNLHPSCLSGAEINLCLENIFYKPVVPKNLKLLQQKHAQQQAALAEAKRQQAQMQMIAAQKNAAALVAKKQQQQIQQQQLQKRQLPSLAPRYNVNVNPRAQSLVPRPGLSPQQHQHIAPVRYNAKSMRPTVANMLNNKANMGAIPVQNSPPGGFEVCEICGGYVKDRKALRIHFFYAHRIDLPFNLFERNQAPLYCATCYVRFWTAQGLRKHIDTHKEENQTRGVVGKCISCGHHVLNLLLHMRIVHNRELQHYINALMCMFCGGHFSSRQDCERHIIKTHGNVDPVSGTLKSPPLASQAVPQPSNVKSGSGQKKSSTPKGGGANNLVKGSVCVLCNLNFGRNVDLTRHCMRMHHTCMKCGMVVIDKASLLKHTCLTSPSGTRDCSMCGESGFHPAYYVKHLRDKHLRKFSIKVAKVRKNVIERWTKRPCPFEDDKEILVEISDSDDDSSGATTNRGRAQQERGFRNHMKKPKIGPACSKIKKPVVPPAKKPKIGPASKIGRRPVVADTDQNSSKDTETKINIAEQTDRPGRKADSDTKKADFNSDNSDVKKKDKNDNSDKEENSHVEAEEQCNDELALVNSEEETTEDKRNGTANHDKAGSVKEKSSNIDEDCESMPIKAEKRKLSDTEGSENLEKRKKSDTISA